MVCAAWYIGLQGLLYFDTGPADAAVDRSPRRQQPADDRHQSAD